MQLQLEVPQPAWYPLLKAKQMFIQTVTSLFVKHIGTVYISTEWMPFTYTALG